MRRPRADEGSAMVEFLVVALVLLVPLVYVVLTAARLQSAAYAATSAVHLAGRAYVSAETPAQGTVRAELAARTALADHGLELPPGALALRCEGGPCLSPGSRVVVALDLRVALPLLPDVLADGPGSVPVRAADVAPVDSFRGEP